MISVVVKYCPFHAVFGSASISPKAIERKVNYAYGYVLS
jgi:hypothetical protein